MKFLDIHHGMKGITHEQLAAEHSKDLAIQGQFGVRFEQAWADPETGDVICISEGPDKQAVQRAHAQAGHPADETYTLSVALE